MTNKFAPAIAACLTYPDPPPPNVLRAAQRILGEGEFAANPLPPAPSREQLQALNNEIQALLDGAPDQIALVYGGATKIKGYVFEAPKLPEIRGASALLDWVNDAGFRQLWREQAGRDLGSEQLAEECIIYASGGNMLAFAPAARGQELAAAIEQCYTEHTLTANSVAVSATFSLLELRYGRNPLAYWVDQFREDWGREDLRPFLASYYYSASNEDSAARFFNRKTFGELVTLLATMANRRRESLASDGPRRDIPHYPLLPWAEKCASSDVRPAVVQASTPNQPLLSEASARKLYIGRAMKRPGLKQDWFEQVFSWRIHNLESWEEQFKKSPHYAEYISTFKGQGSPVPAQDVGEIAQASRPDRFIGLIYADGNNVGRRVARTSTPAAYQNLSEDLDRASKEAVFQALAKHLRPVYVRTDEGNREWVHPFEIITIGGDDLLLIVPGSAALDIALTIGYAFEYELRQRSPDRPRPPDSRYKPGIPPGGYDFTAFTPEIGLSAGVVIAPEATPIFFLRELAEELLKSAKKKARQQARQQADGGGAVDFMVMKSITMVTDDIRTFRGQALGTGTESRLRLTARPYTWLELQGLLAAARALRANGFPRSQLYRLRQRLFAAQQEGGITASVMEYLYTQTRGLKSADRDLLRTAFDLAWHGPPKDISPWRHQPVEVRTDEPVDAPLREKQKIDVRAYETIWPDLAEIYDFAGQSGTTAQAEQSPDRGHVDG